MAFRPGQAKGPSVRSSAAGGGTISGTGDNPDMGYFTALNTLGNARIYRISTEPEFRTALADVTSLSVSKVLFVNFTNITLTTTPYTVYIDGSTAHINIIGTEIFELIAGGTVTIRFNGAIQLSEIFIHNPITSFGFFADTLELDNVNFFVRKMDWSSATYNSVGAGGAFFYQKTFSGSLPSGTLPITLRNWESSLPVGFAAVESEIDWLKAMENPTIHEILVVGTGFLSIAATTIIVEGNKNIRGATLFFAASITWTSTTTNTVSFYDDVRRTGIGTWTQAGAGFFFLRFRNFENFVALIIDLLDFTFEVNRSSGAIITGTGVVRQFFWDNTALAVAGAFTLEWAVSDTLSPGGGPFHMQPAVGEKVNSAMGSWVTFPMGYPIQKSRTLISMAAVVGSYSVPLGITTLDFSLYHFPQKSATTRPLGAGIFIATVSVTIDTALDLSTGFYAGGSITGLGIVIPAGVALFAQIDTLPAGATWTDVLFEAFLV